jgi:FkbM family methyltransferase
LTPLPLRLVQLARRIRHSPALRRAAPLWNLVRPLYQRLLDPLGRGVPLTLGGRCVRMPAQLLSINPDWTAYERESFAALGEWLDRHPGDATLLDIGCSVGVVSSFALQLSPRLQVVAFDSDLVSLRALDAVVPRAAAPRLRRVAGLLGPVHLSRATLESALAGTARNLPDLPPAAAISRSQFLCFGETGAGAVPHHQLDALVAPEAFPGPMLIKCDVEGAELLVLQGAARLLRARRPDLLLSVHPGLLPRHAATAGDVAALLEHHGYAWRVLARDHEEHWLAQPTR